MSPPSSRRRTIAVAFAATVAVAVAAGTGLAVAAATGDAGRSAVPAAGDPGPAAAPFTVTLVTGDRVTVTGQPGGRYGVRVSPGPGRTPQLWSTHRTRTGLQVLPRDAAPLVAAGRVDARLFDVLLLHRLGYHDGATGQIPVLTTGARARGAAPGAARTTPAARGGARTVAALDALGARSARVDKRDAARFWDATRGAPAGERLWLVGTRHTTAGDARTLAEPTAQIGVPAARRAGLTGSGVTVAVLDSGVDTGHPDLAKAVTVSKDFTGSRTGIRDGNGHGTHVAATLAGRGAAPHGTGVAPAAKLAVGKVCDDRGACPDDAVLAGMQWAATTAKARVVNMSLGGPVGEGPDPLADAVATLTTRTGTLFVIAAGNDGPEAGTVGSPGSAPAALTVGSVGRTGALSEFSSRGPVTAAGGAGPYTLKPDLTAPGEAVVAARAAGTLDDEATGPGRRYAALSGTSMATPHAAGAAALLAQQHPRWRAERLKAALTGTATPHPGDTAYGRGAGLVDLARAVRAGFTAGRGVLDLGYVRWSPAGPAPVTRTLTWTNHGRTALALTLGAALTGPDGRPLPARALTLDRSTLSVAPGATGTATLTYTPAGTPDGLQTGTVTARAADGTTVTTTVGAYHEPESYDVTFTAVNRAGRPAAYVETLLYRGGSGDRPADHVMWDGSFRQRLRAGDWTVANVVGEGADGRTAVSAVARSVRVDRNLTVTLDSRGGRRYTPVAPRADARLRGWVYGHAAGPKAFSSFAGDVPLYLVAGPAVADFSAGVTAQLTPRDADDPGAAGAAWSYDLTADFGDRLPDDATFRYTAADVADVDTTVDPLTRGAVADTSVLAFAPRAALTFGVGLPLRGATRRHLFVGGPAGTIAALDTSSTLGAGRDAPTAWFSAAAKAYPPGRRYPQRWQSPVLSPGFGGAAAATRLGDDFEAYPPTSGDAAGHYGMVSGTGTSRLLRGGTVVATGSSDRLSATLPAAAATYRLETEHRHDLGLPLSTRVSTAWTFRSGRTPGGPDPRPVPLALPRFTPALRGGYAPKGAAFTVPVHLDRTPGTPAAPVTRLGVDVSYDGGRTWAPTVVRADGDHWAATLRHPAAAGAVSLRVTAATGDGGTVRQSVVAAYLTR